MRSSLPCQNGEVFHWIYTCWYKFPSFSLNSTHGIQGQLDAPHPENETPEDRRRRLVRQFLDLGVLGREVSLTFIHRQQIKD